MKAEIIAVGTELLMGQIVNTNAQFLSIGLAELGIGVYYQTVVGDNPVRMKEALEIAKNRADLIVCTGGLGPTQDDLTKNVLAEFLEKNLIMHQPSMDKMVEMFSTRGIPMVESNARQAWMLEHSVPLTNDTGLAVGVALSQEEKHYILLPGPPKEMRPMFQNYAKPWIQSITNSKLSLYSVMLKFAGIGESSLEHELIDLIDAQTDPTIAPYAKEGEVVIRLTTRASSAAEANERLQPLEGEIRRRVGQYIFAAEDIPLEKKILEILFERGETLAVAESCTGGQLSDLLTAIPGSSEAFLGGVICYTNRLKHKLLDVPMTILEGPGAPGAVSEETAIVLAENALRLTSSDYGVSVTGVAGPGESEGKPVGLVHVGVAKRNGETGVKTLRLSGNRETIKLRAAKSALYELWKQLK